MLKCKKKVDTWSLRVDEFRRRLFRRRGRVDAVDLLNVGVDLFCVGLLRLGRHLVETKVVVEVDGGQGIQGDVMDEFDISEL
jgi:hypothetical protein